MSAALKLTTAGGALLTHMLPQPLGFQVVPSRRTSRYVRDSLDLSAREVIAIGSGREELEARIRFEPNAHDLIEIMAHAADGSTITYYPDVEGPGFDMLLVNQGDEVGVDWSDAVSPLYQFEKTVRFRDASASGRSLEALYQPWLWRHRGGSARRYGTFTRSGAVGAYRDIDGLQKQAAANVLRTSWRTVNGVWRPHTLLEVPRTNKFLRTEALDNAAWTKAAASIVTNTSLGPDGVASLDQLIEDNTNAAHLVSQAVTGMVANGYYAVSWYARANTRSWMYVDVYETAAPTNVVRVWFNLATGVVGSNSVGGTGAFVGYEIEDVSHIVSGLLRVTLVGSVGNGATAVTSQAGLTTGDGVTVYAGDGTSSIWLGYPQIEDGRESSSYIPNVATAQARGAEAFSDAFPYTPAQLAAMGGATFYVDFVEGMRPNWALEGGESPTLVAVTAAPTASPFLSIYRNAGGDSYQLDRNGSRVSSVDLNPARGSRIQLAGQCNPDGSVRLLGRKDGSTNATGSASAALALESAFSGQSIRLGGVGTAGRGIQEFQDMIVFPGLLSIDECERIAA